MYSYQIPRLPTQISREEFVELVFDLGRENSHGYDTTIASVQLGDYFVSFDGPRIPHVILTFDERIRVKRDKFREQQALRAKGETIDMGLKARIISRIIAERPNKTFVDEPLPQVYSIELAHVVSVILAKYNETIGYRSTKKAISNANNCILLKMEWEILYIIDFRPKVYNFISLIGFMTKDEYSPKLRRLSSVFWDLSKEVCLNRDLLKANPLTTVMGICLLGRHGKLRATQTNREREFREFMVQIAKEFEIDLSELLRTYIQTRTASQKLST
jgi:hypothetical protein